jgi:hypothetical protein
VQYQTTFNFNPAKNEKSIWINLNEVSNMAEVFVNGKSCGIAWTAPFRVNISIALKQGVNELKITVVNTWANRLIGDSKLPPEKRVTNTVYPFNFSNRQLLPAGLLGPVVIESAN